MKKTEPLSAPPFEQPLQMPPLAARIVYQSGRLLVVNKLPGEAVEGAAPGMGDLPRLLAELAGPPASVSPPAEYPDASAGTPIPITAVNRLDVPVSGCALFARTKEALAQAHEQFRRGTVEKHYWAIIEMPAAGGAPLPEAGELIDWLTEDPRKNRIHAFDEEAPGRKRAVLRYRVAGAGERYLFLEIELITGRRHQIRAQLEKRGLHIKGDLRYGAKRSEKNGGIRLHAASLAFRDGEPVRVNAPPPDMDRLWEAAAAAITRT
jgi:23S rRNA pseudouridine1911/1915/1917 synthase